MPKRYTEVKQNEDGRKVFFLHSHMRTRRILTWVQSIVGLRLNSDDNTTKSPVFLEKSG